MTVFKSYGMKHKRKSQYANFKFGQFSMHSDLASPQTIPTNVASPCATTDPTTSAATARDMMLRVCTLMLSLGMQQV